MVYIARVGALVNAHLACCLRQGARMPVYCAEQWHSPCSTAAAADSRRPFHNHAQHLRTAVRAAQPDMGMFGTVLQAVSSDASDGCFFPGCRRCTAVGHLPFYTAQNKRNHVLMKTLFWQVVPMG